MIKVTFHNGDMVETKEIKEGHNYANNGAMLEITDKSGKGLFSCCSGRFISLEVTPE